MKIEKDLIKLNQSSRNGQKIKYIVIHDTGNLNKGADALAHRKYFGSKNRNASAHYFVDGSKIIQIIDDKNASWHCGDGRGRYGITNQNSIGVEICVNSDSDYDKAVSNTAYLVKYLMQKYNLDMESVKRHFDASRKTCPKSMSRESWKKWFEFWGVLRSE